MATSPENDPNEVSVILGTFFSSLDDKHRLTVPAKIRTALTERFYLIREADDNIGIYSFAIGQDIFEHCERLQCEHPEDEDVAAAVDRIVGSAVEVVAESDWRVQIPEVLRYYAQLDKKVVTVGALNHCVLWDRDRWEADQEKIRENQKAKQVHAVVLRGAAAGIRKQVKPAETVQPREMGEEAVAAAEAGTGRQGVGGGGRGLESEPGAAIASAGDGGRSSRILRLSQLGR